MPGIVGIIGNGSVKKNEYALRQMLKCMLYESSYTSGTYVNDRLRLCVGWVNRAESFSDCMPVWNETNEVCLIYYGENFAEKGLSDKLKSQGHKFELSNASYLIHLFEEKDREFLKHLNGWFCGILIDLRREEAILFNDRYGMQRIYYHEGNDTLYFSSEAKSLLMVCPELRQLDKKGLGEVFSFGCVLENRTLFSNISLLSPGSVWTFGNGRRIRRDNYFKSDTWENQLPLEKEDFYKRLKETFVNILPRYFDTKAKIALSLTGGLDTRMIMACMNVQPGELPCYTFGSMYHDNYDVKISRQVAKICQQTHQVLEVGRTFFSEFPSLAEKTVYITDGNLDVSASADLYVNKLAREIAPIRLTGNYGSEILRGTRHLKALPACVGLFESSFEKQINTVAAETLRENFQGHRVSFAAFKQPPWFHYNRLALEQSQLTLRSPYMDNDLVRLMFQAPLEVLNGSELSFRLINDGNRALGNIMTDRGLGGNNGYLFSNFAHLYREFLFKADYAFNYGMPQWLAKLDHYLLAPLHIEKIFLGRHKFYHFRIWFRDELSAYVKELLLDKRSLKRPYLNSKFVEKLVLEHTSGKKNYTTEITKLLTLELLQRLMID
jgi:asparagine synthase (glutamine-hydrolysing)